MDYKIFSRRNNFRKKHAHKHRHLFTAKILCLCKFVNRHVLRADLKLSRDVINFKDNGNLFNLNGAVYKRS